jgi:hypothetical protein
MVELQDKVWELPQFTELVVLAVLAAVLPILLPGSSQVARVAKVNIYLVTPHMHLTVTITSATLAIQFFVVFYLGIRMVQVVVEAAATHPQHCSATPAEVATLEEGEEVTGAQAALAVRVL